jgi:glutamyl-tRNA synthetase
MIITRIPPSPTGHLHIGTARTALFNYLFAKHHNGKLVFRSEDTDRQRSKIEFENEIIEGLQWLGISWDNKTITRQSERAEVYQKHLQQLIDNNKAYVSLEPSKANPQESVEVIRLRNPNTRITFNDLIRGEISFDTTELGDFVIARSITDALYHFTVVVDDNEAGVTHILRGEDHISNTPRQILIQEALGFMRPQYAHIPLILAPDRSKMSKRHGATAIRDYREEGFLPEAIINYLALLGWNGGNDREFFTLSELIATFSIEKVQKSGAVFDKKKLLWYNRYYLDRLSNNAFDEYITQIPFFNEINKETFDRLRPLLRERTESREELQLAITQGDFSFISETINYDVTLLKWKKDTTIKDVVPRLKQLEQLLEHCDFESIDSIKNAVWHYAETTGKGEVLWPLRVALSGQERSPDPFSLAFIIGKSTTLSRIATAYGKIESDVS